LFDSNGSLELISVNRLPKTRNSLLLRLADAKDCVAWGEFLDVYEQTILRFARSRGLQTADAEDVTQRVLVAVLDKVRDWKLDATRGSFGAWVLRVTRNLAAKAWNERNRSPFASRGGQNCGSLADVPGVSNEDKTIFQLEYRRSLFRWAADRVRDQVENTTWQAFWMTAVQGLDPGQVAKKLGASLSSVYTAKCRVLSRIRSEIERFEKEFENR
jgi:RNA polymerase sigma-70 factor (ECF subfamily)